MFLKLSLTLLAVCLISSKGYCYYDTCDCSNKSEQKFQYEDSFTLFDIYSPKTDLCISDTLKLNIRITNISEDTICIFNDLKLNYNKSGDYPNIFVNIGNNFTSNIDYTVEMTLLGPSLTHIFEVKIPISTFLHGCESEKIVVNLGYGYLPRVNEVRSFANKEDKYCLVSKSALYISSMLVELYNQSYENALFGFRICK